jgi:hypothetical protein
MTYKILFILIIIILLFILYYLLKNIEGFEETVDTSTTQSADKSFTLPTNKLTSQPADTSTTSQPADTSTTSQPADTSTTSQPAYTSTTTATLNKYNKVINKLDELTTSDKNAEVPIDLKIDILELTQTQQVSLCEDYCQVYGGCTPLCNFLGCDNCKSIPKTTETVYRQPDELQQNQVPRTQGNTHIGEPNPMNISHSGNGESNIFAPYVVVHKKRPGERYNAYVMSNPHDPNYYNYINNLS